MYLSALSLALNRPGAVGLTLEQAVAALFANNEQGAWYDPSDYSTMFEDATGLTPISTVEKAVGLIFDRRKGGLTARRNRLTFSEQLDNAAWTPTASTISANTSDTTDPIGTNTAEKYTNTAAADNITRTAAVTVVAATDYAFSIYAKKGTQDWLRLSGWADSLGTTIGFNAWFDLANGQTGSIASGAGGTAVSSSIQSAGNGWYRCIVVGRLASATTLYPVACMTTADNVATRPATSNVVYLWGAQLDRASSASTYQKIESGTGGEWTAGNHAYQTTSAARPVLRARYNLLTYSEQFDTTWLNAGVVVTANNTNAPDGTATAESIVETAGGSNHEVYKAVSVVANTTYSFSCHFKQANNTKVLMFANYLSGTGLVWALIDLTGVASPVTSANVTAVAVPAANGFIRATITAASGAATTCNFGFSLSQTAGTFNYSGVNGNGIYVWGADLRVGTSAGDYQRIAASTDYATTSTITGQPFRPYIDFEGAGDRLQTAAIAEQMTTYTCWVGTVKDLPALDVFQRIFDRNGNRLLTFTNQLTRPNCITASNDYATTDMQTDSAGDSVPILIPNVLSARWNGSSAATDVVFRRNGSLLGYGSAVQTDGNGSLVSDANQALFIGDRAAGDRSFDGRMYAFILRFANSTAGEIASGEAYVASKIGVTL